LLHYRILQNTCTSFFRWIFRVSFYLFFKALFFTLQSLLFWDKTDLLHYRMLQNIYVFCWIVRVSLMFQVPQLVNRWHTTFHITDLHSSIR
jgi:hypothetical protein